MKSLVRFFVDRPLLVNLLTLAVCILGAIQVYGTPRSLMPDQEATEVKVEAELPGTSAVDMERVVTFRLEEALSGMREVDQMTSKTQNARAQIILEVKPEYDLSSVMEKARSRIGAVRHRLPDNMEPVRVSEHRTSVATLMVVNVRDLDTTDPDQRRAASTVAERMRRIPDVLTVDTTLEDVHLYIRFDRKALEERQIDVRLARRRIMGFVRHMPVGSVRVKDEEIAVEMSAGFDRIDDLRTLPLLANRRGKATLLGDIATVEFDSPPELTSERLDGSEDFVTYIVESTSDADAIDVSRRLRDFLQTEAPSILPDDASIHIQNDTSQLIAHEQQTLISNGLIGIGIVLFVLFIFLGWRVSLVTALGLPVAYLGVGLLLPYFGVKWSLVSLVGLILVIGILVDDAIIVADAYCQALETQESSREAAVEAVGGIAKPVLGMVATNIIVFLPLVFLESDFTWAIRPIPIVIILALVFSLVESFFLLPNHLHHLVGDAGRRVGRGFFEPIERAYSSALEILLKGRYLAPLVIAGLVGLSVYLLQGPMKVDPGLRLQGRTTIHIELDQPADSLDELARTIQPVERLIDELPDEVVQSRRTTLGQAQRGATGWGYAHIEVTPKGGDFVEQEKRRHELAEKLKPKLKQIRESHSEFDRLSVKYSKKGEERDVVEVYVSGGDRIPFETIQNEIRGAVQDIETVKRVEMDPARFQTAWTFDVDEKTALAYDLTRKDIQQQLREHFSSEELLRLRNRGQEIAVHTDFQEDLKPSRATLGGLTIVGGNDVSVPLKNLGQWRQIEVLRKIEHRNLLRVFKVDVAYDADKTTGQEVESLVERKLEPVRQKYPGYRVSVEASQQTSELKQWLLRVGAMCLLSVFIVLALALDSLIQPVLILFALVFGFVGAILALFVQGMPIGVMAVIGILGLAGVVVNDSLVMAATINENCRRRPDDQWRAAIIDGATSRLRAIVLTSITTLAGVFPLAYGLLGDPGWFQPMIITLGWGLLSATVLTLILLPCVVAILEDVRRIPGWMRGWFGEEP